MGLIGMCIGASFTVAKAGLHVASGVARGTEKVVLLSIMNSHNYRSVSERLKQLDKR